MEIIISVILGLLVGAPFGIVVAMIILSNLELEKGINYFLDRTLGKILDKIGL